jgi:hypothetical protein
MKVKIQIVVVCVLCLFALPSCKKDIPSDKLGYIGDWQCASCSKDEVKILNIKNDGTGKYESVEPGLSLSIAGNVKFDGNDFRIGGAIIKKKFKTNQYPTKIVLSLNPYKIKWVATFNGVDYTKAN